MSKEINLEGYRLAHTMIRVKDLEASFNFYCKTLGMKVLRKTDYPEGKFTNAFIGYGLETESPCLELTHNWDQKEDYDKGCTAGTPYLQCWIRCIKVGRRIIKSGSYHQQNQDVFPKGITIHHLLINGGSRRVVRLKNSRGV